MVINIELRTPNMQWVFLEKVFDSTADEIASYLKIIKSAFPQNAIRLVDPQTGKIIDLI